MCAHLERVSSQLSPRDRPSERFLTHVRDLELDRLGLIVGQGDLARQVHSGVVVTLPSYSVGGALFSGPDLAT